jgi:8-amino-7-oxononanoate synthase
MFTASLPPSIVGSVRQALATLRAKPELMQKLWANVDTLYDGVKAAGFKLGAQKGPVVAVHLTDPARAGLAWHMLLQRGVYVNLALPPATPSGTALLRCSVCAAHSTEQLQRVVAALTEVGQELGLIAETNLRVAAAE